MTRNLYPTRAWLGTGKAGRGERRSEGATTNKPDKILNALPRVLILRDGDKAVAAHAVTEVVRFTDAHDVKADVDFCGDGLTFRFVTPKPDYKSVKIHLASNPPAAPQVGVVTGMTGASDWYWYSEGGEGWALPGWRRVAEKAEKQLKLKRLYKRTEAHRHAAIQEDFSKRMTKRLIAEAHLDRQYVARAVAPVDTTNLYVPPECRRLNLGRYGYKEIRLTTKVPGSPSYLRWLRGVHGISRADLAEAAGVSIKTVARFETSELTWAKAHHHSVEATTADKIREAGVAATTEAAIRTALDGLIRELEERDALGRELPENRLVPRLYAENLAALQGMAYARARDIVRKEMLIRGHYATLFASDIEDIALAGLSHLLKRGDVYDHNYGKKRGRRQAKYTTWAHGPIWTGCNTEAGRLRNLRGRDTTGTQLATFLPLDEGLVTEAYQPNPKRKLRGHGPDVDAAQGASDHFGLRFRSIRMREG